MNDEGCRTPDGGVGRCIQLRGCQPMKDILKIIKRPIPQYLRAILNSYVCGYESGKLQICCPSTPIIIPKSILEPPDVSSHPNIKLLPKDCGYIDIEDKIRYGTNTSFNEFPWMSLLSYKTGKVFAYVYKIKYKKN